LLNIGKLRQGAADYYLGEIASSPQDYYLGHGEAAGRWVGSLSERLGLSGEVTEVEFRRLLGAGSASPPRRASWGTRALRRRTP
jgi:hypothetical protein